ncbi:hypothetical protein H109_01395 [Trichophyton interdigitale MR816]|uniref:Uncharacterized protein n=1 Tax=Trichophyton interdigitale (strain MR816) TaxID=1215338 RepID=A0A059JG11_TRIIM|nr:hypothetical protein H101_02851 [Trichophyton interdigitale H6]KDB26826.1 hypothetical protein H109_01395 [Trichophyton interdigitale MR816]
MSTATQNHRVGGYEPLPAWYRNRNNRPFESTGSSRRATESIRNGREPRITFSKTRTLTGAFEATESPRNTARANSGQDDEEAPRYNRAGRERNGPAVSPKFKQSSLPSRELLEPYRTMDDADNLADLDVQEDQVRRDQGSPSPAARNRRIFDQKAENIYDIDLDFLDDVSDDDLRMKLAQHALDERRLKRATKSTNGPIFSRAKDTDLKTALSMQNLQRHEAEKKEEDIEHPEPELDNQIDPAVNIPRTWGSRGRRSREWLDGVVTTTNGVDNKQNEDDIRLPVEEWGNDFDFTARSLQVSDSPPVKASQDKQDNSFRAQFSMSAAQDSQLEKTQDPDMARLDLRPDTGSSAHSYGTAEKPRFASGRGSSSQLLRKLTRRSSSPVKTPEQQRIATKTPLTAKTPVVTGAWIDTPITERSKTPHIENIKKEEQGPETQPKSVEDIPKANKASDSRQRDLHTGQRKSTSRPMPLKKPKLPKSALESILEKEKSGEYSLILGDNTLDSLKDILEDKPFSEKSGDEQVKSEPSLSSFHVDTDEETLDRVNSKLKSLLHNINEARAGLSSLEHQAEETIARPGSGALKNKNSRIRHHNHSTAPCEACGLYGDGRLYLALPSRRFWKRISFVFLIFFTWWIAELAMCDYYCHPLYASRCERNCLNPNAPRYPFVIPTMLWRWSHLSVVLSPLWTIFVALFRLTAQLFGFWDGFVESSNSVYRPRNYEHYQPPISVAYQPSAAVYDQSDSMQGDEYL